MIAVTDRHAWKPGISSREAMIGTVADVVRLKLKHAALTAEMESEIEKIKKSYAKRLDDLAISLRDREAQVHEYCAANRRELFPDKKSIDTASAVIGFELTPWRGETSNRKIKWADVVGRLLKLAWGKAYVRNPAPQPDKEALLTDREKLTPEQLTSAGLAFCQDEQFFIRPKSEIAEATVAETK